MSVSNLSNEMSSLITSSLKDPRDWLTAVRQILDLASINPSTTLAISDGTLDSICWSTLDNVSKKYSNGLDKIAVAIRVWRTKNES